MGRLILAVFGAGRAGSIHARNAVMTGRAEIKWIVDAVPNNGRKLSDELPSQAKVVKFGDHDQVLQDKSVNAVIVTVPSLMHEEVIKGCLKAGKAVFCEKPLTLDSLSTKECFELSQANGKPLICGFNRRFDPTVQSIHDQVQRGTLGQIKSIKICSRDPEYPTGEYAKSSGGIFKDSCCHDIDIICYILKEFPETVYAIGHAFNPDIASVGDYDQVFIVMKFPSGVNASIDMNRKAVYGYDQRLEGMLQEGNLRPTATILNTSDGERQDSLVVQFTDRYKDAYRNEMDHFIDVIAGQRDSIVTGKQTEAVIKIAEACLQSVETGQAVKMDYS
ncbi:hypothetical protein BSL78_07277 [Apostichopus japonicus]|uniref:Uncharacterized protein n=1 Tax=Stichopus japonicus TaxID=307972 RepID=A0A2G8L690_STIJA|nr:hypothetical protein BSL78_07277 [Apostichopus japonicus]